MTAAQKQQHFVAHLDAVLTEYKNIEIRHLGRTQVISHEEVELFLTRARAAIHRIARRQSVYFEHCERIMQSHLSNEYKLRSLVGVLKSLRADIDAGYIKSYTELIHGELFADLLDMSRHLLDEGYKDAAAVIVGSSLEAHLRQLCQKNGIDTETTTTAGTAAKKADRLNADLAGANVYTKLDQKNVTAWLDLRNKAAHGHYDQCQSNQVALLLSGVRDFIARNPA